LISTRTSPGPGGSSSAGSIVIGFPRSQRMAAVICIKTLLNVSKRRGLPREIGDSLIEVGKPRIVGLTVFVSVKNLLNYDGDLEERERFVPSNAAGVATGSRGVAFDDLSLAQVSRSIGHGGQRILLQRGRCWRPVRQENSQVDQWIAERAHLPVEDRDEAA